ncbi:hypothetical protein H0A58_12960 [Alcaligenaceae bacterium]|nr:hypothetical protein [Alcaligenaceae bacterium]
MSKRGRPIADAGAQQARPTEAQAKLDFEVEADLMLKRHMIRLDWGYQDLAEALKPLGITRTATAINRRINRGNFSAGFLLACLAAMRVEVTLRPEEGQADQAI